MRLAVAASVALAALAIATSPARADGFYFADTIGPGTARGDLGQEMDQGTLRYKIALGFRWGHWAIEPFYAWEEAQLADSGGQSQQLTSYGLDIKRVQPISEHVSLYVRGSASHLAPPAGEPCCFATPDFVPAGNTQIYGYAGRGLGVGVGAQLTGRIPIIGGRAGIFVEESYDWYRLLPPSGDTYEQQVDGSITRFSIGFAVGTDF